jgi:hypothetical protein
MKRNEAVARLANFLETILSLTDTPKKANAIIDYLEANEIMMPTNVIFHATGEYININKLDILNDYDCELKWEE